MHTDRRAFLRVMAAFPVGVTRLDAKQGQEPAFSGTTVNICAGGAKMIAPADVTSGERLRLEVRFAQPPFLVFTDATVTRVEATADGRAECALRFDDLDIYIEQRIVRWVFSEQRRVAERRAAVRVPVEVPAWCEPAGSGEQFKARTIDLAGDGARIVTARWCRATASTSSSTSTSPPTGWRALPRWCGPTWSATTGGPTACASTGSTGRRSARSSTTRSRASSAARRPKPQKGSEP
jgi:hypothetical protein